MKPGSRIPTIFTDAHLLYETMWSPQELDAVDETRLGLYLLYRQVRQVRDYGGKMLFPEEPGG